MVRRSARLGKAHSKYTANYSPWGLDDRTPLGASLPGTLSTGAPIQSAALGLGTSASFGTNCTNCFAIPKGNGTAFNPINGGVGPTAPFSASQLNWTTFNVAGNSGTNGTRNEFDPFFHGQGYEVAPQQRNAAVMTVDQRLTKNISFYGSGFYSNRRVEQLVAEGAIQVTTTCSGSPSPPSIPIIRRAALPPICAWPMTSRSRTPRFSTPTNCRTAISSG